MTSAAIGMDFFFLPLSNFLCASGDLYGVGAWSSFEKRSKGDRVSHDDSRYGTDVSPHAVRGIPESSVVNPCPSRMVRGQ